MTPEAPFVFSIAAPTKGDSAWPASEAATRSLLYRYRGDRRRIGRPPRGTVGFFEWQRLFLLSRPMVAFVLVLGSLRHD